MPQAQVVPTDYFWLEVATTLRSILRKTTNSSVDSADNCRRRVWPLLGPRMRVSLTPPTIGPRHRAQKRRRYTWKEKWRGEPACGRQARGYTSRGEAG